MKTVRYLALSSLVSVLSFAANAEGFRPYVGVDAGGVHASYENAATGVSGDAVLEDNLLFANPYVGVEVNKYLAFEAGYFQTKKEDKNFDASLVGGDAGTNLKSEIDISGVNLDAVGKYDLTPKFSVLGDVGVLFYDTDVRVSNGSLAATESKNDTALKLGGGVQYSLTDNIAARTKVEYLDISDGFVTYSAGLQYKF